MQAIARILAATAVALGALGYTQVAHACKFTRTPWGLTVTDCKLSDLYGDRYDLAVDIQRRTSLVPKLPNLVVSEVDTAVIEQAVDVSVELRNAGSGKAGTFEAAVMATVTDPLNSGAPAGPAAALGPVGVLSLAAGASADKYAGRVFLPNRAQDWDVCTVVVVDPPSFAAPGGRVWESNESDNQWPSQQQDGCCRVYGPKPDVSGPPGCF